MVMLQFQSATRERALAIYDVLLRGMRFLLRWKYAAGKD